MDASSEETVFEMILYGGNARSCAMEAIRLAKKGDFVNAREKLAQAGEEITKAHRIQTTLIQREAGGNSQPITLLMVHAQDHLMNAISIQDLASEFVDLYERIHISGGVQR
ncbi:PTS cellobiose IIA component [Kroppenstedtia guangzhouensis]|uniref:PTS cellobiose IIA component n=1 Tax=Kroppenstedtia guangzhouensis TaxID=1274356 RepID=A0ABQ1GS07_9BACL|nr:PTS lactose/cellobiose transporter subunit IIA [Kroppenstedtia guangzhouensis]GGA49159.1 PTS cellobiose IIA component [Kroppenstedtia guangzhouensis]